MVGAAEPRWDWREGGGASKDEANEQLDVAMRKYLPSGMYFFTVNLHVNVNVKWFRHFPVKSHSRVPTSVLRFTLASTFFPTSLAGSWPREIS